MHGDGNRGRNKTHRGGYSRISGRGGFHPWGQNGANEKRRPERSPRLFGERQIKGVSSSGNNPRNSRNKGMKENNNSRGAGKRVGEKEPEFW